MLGVCHCSPFLPFGFGSGHRFAPSWDLADCNVPEDAYWKDYLQLWSASRNETPDPLPLKQSTWDRPGIEKDRASIESGLSTPLQRAAFNAARSRHCGTGYWPCQLLHVVWSLTTRRSESQLEPGWLWNFAFLISAAVGQKSINLAVTVLSVNEHQAEL